MPPSRTQPSAVQGGGCSVTLLLVVFVRRIAVRTAPQRLWLDRDAGSEGLDQSHLGLGRGREEGGGSVDLAGATEGSRG